MPLRTSRLVNLASGPRITAALAGNKFQGESLSATRANRDLDRESVRVRNENVGLQNKDLKRQMDELPEIRAIRARAASGDKLAQLMQAGIEPRMALQTKALVDSWGEEEAAIKERQIQKTMALAVSKLGTATKEQLPGIYQAMTAAGLAKEVLDHQKSLNKVHNIPAGGQLRNSEGTLLASNPKQEAPQGQTTFGSGIVGASQETLLEMAQKQDRGEALTVQDRMRLEFAKANLEQERTTFRQGPGGETIGITTRPELPPSVQERFGTNQGSGTKVESITAPKDDKKAKAERAKTVQKMKSAQRQALQLAEFVSNNPDVVGLVGQGKKIGSAITGAINQIVPGDPLPVSTSTKRFERNLILLQSDLRELIDKGRFSDEDRKRLELLAGGTDWMSSPQSVLEGFEDIGRFTQQVIDDNSPQDDIMAQAEEQARLNNWSDEEKQRYEDLLRNQNGNP